MYLNADEAQVGLSDYSKRVAIAAIDHFGMYEGGGNDVEPTYWTTDKNNGGLPGGIVSVSQMPVKNGFSCFICFSLKPPSDALEGGMWMDDPTIHLYVSKQWHEIDNQPDQGILGRVVGMKKSADNDFSYLERWSFRGGDSGWSVFKFDGAGIKILKSKNYPGQAVVQEYRDKVTEGLITQEAFDKWHKSSHQWPEGYEEYSPEVRWTTVGELVKNKNPTWRKGPLPATFEEFALLKKEVPAIKYSELRAWAIDRIEGKK